MGSRSPGAPELLPPISHQRQGPAGDASASGFPHPVTVVDYGVGNIGAVLNMLDYIGVEATASSDPRGVAAAAKLLLPGVGAFDRAMTTIRKRGLVEPLEEARANGAVVLGICLGAQLLGRRSDEGEEAGLGWIAADCRRIDPTGANGVRVPHMGWSEVTPARPSVLFPPEGGPERFYFAHSYALRCDDPADVAATIDYGERLTCAVSSGRIHGAQFHPEKSHRFGMRFLRAFAAA